MTFCLERNNADINKKGRNECMQDSIDLADQLDSESAQNNWRRRSNCRDDVIVYCS